MSDIITALGPGRKLDSLTSFAPDYITVRRAFNDLLVFPHLEAIEVEDASKTNLLSLVTDGNKRFSELSSIDIELARKVIGYDATFSALVDVLSVQLLVQTLQPVAQEYADHARAQSEANLKFFADFSTYIGSVDSRIAAMSQALAQLDDQIQAQSAALASKNIVSTLWEVLKTLYKLASTAEESDVQIAAILGVTISTVAGSFKNLFDDQARLQRIITSLKGLRTRTQDLKTRFVALSAGLKTVSVGSKSLLDVWDDVAARMGSVAETTDLVAPPQATQLKAAWAKVAADAKSYIDALQQTVSAKATSNIASHLAAKFNADPKVPITAADATVTFTLTASDEQVIKTVLGPPAGIQKGLGDLTDSAGLVIEQFDTLLQQPHVEQHHFTSPVDGSDSNLFTVISYYRNEYLKLQQDTIPVARDLGSYAALQAAFLPLVVPDAQATGADIVMSVFLSTNISIVADYKVKAKALFDRSYQVNNAWDSFVDSVNKSIAVYDQNITTFNNNVYNLTEKQTLYTCLSASGVFRTFTVAAFLPGVGMLAALGNEAALGRLDVSEAISAGKIAMVINDLRAAMANIESIKLRLQDLHPFLTGIESSMNFSSISHTALSGCESFYAVLNGPTGPPLLNVLRPQMIKDWVMIQGAVDEYVKAVST